MTASCQVCSVYDLKTLSQMAMSAGFAVEYAGCLSTSTLAQRKGLFVSSHKARNLPACSVARLKAPPAGPYLLASAAICMYRPSLWPIQSKKQVPRCILRNLEPFMERGYSTRRCHRWYTSLTTSSVLYSLGWHPIPPSTLPRSSPRSLFGLSYRKTIKARINSKMSCDATPPMLRPTRCVQTFCSTREPATVAHLPLPIHFLDFCPKGTVDWGSRTQKEVLALNRGILFSITPASTG